MVSTTPEFPRQTVYSTLDLTPSATLRPHTSSFQEMHLHEVGLSNALEIAAETCKSRKRIMWSHVPFMGTSEMATRGAGMQHLNIEMRIL